MKYNYTYKDHFSGSGNYSISRLTKKVIYNFEKVLLNQEDEKYIQGLK